MDGEGSLRDIYINTGYALTPMILFNLAAIPLSHIFVLQEGLYLTALHSIGTVWTLLLIFTGILVAQQYTFLKNVVTCVLSVLGMAVLLFIALLCVSMYSQVIQFFQILFFELVKR